MTKRDELISRIRKMKLSRFIEDTLIKGVEILTDDNAYELFAISKLSAGSLSDGEMFKLLGALNEHGTVNQWIGKDYTHILLSYFDEKTPYHIHMTNDGFVKVGIHSRTDRVISYEDFENIIGYLSNKIKNASNRDKYKMFDPWTISSGGFDYSNIPETRIVAFENYIRNKDDDTDEEIWHNAT